ncbi:MAG: MarR family transcriptional regulator [Pseudomonadota bacterium]
MSITQDIPSGDTRRDSPDAALDGWLCFAVYGAEHAFTQFYRPILGQLGLTYPQCLVMMLLWAEDDRSIRDIGGALHLKSSTLTPLIKRLEEAGLVTRLRDRHDERVVRVQLTEAGHELRRELPDIPAQVRSALSMNEAEVAETIETLLRIQSRLRAASP